MCSAYLEQAPLSMFKADIDAAYRRIPLKPSQRHLAAVVFLLAGLPLIIFHQAMPFGAKASVHAWDRIGKSACLLQHARESVQIHACQDLFSAPSREEFSGYLF